MPWPKEGFRFHFPKKTQTYACHFFRAVILRAHDTIDNFRFPALFLISMLRWAAKSPVPILACCIIF